MEHLPEQFISLRKPMLGSEWETFYNCMHQTRSYGLRINPTKTIAASLSFLEKPVPWAKYGFYADANLRPGKHPLHEAGAYYIQEPSAMSVASLLEPVPGDIICDLCAAPGGKSTQIAGALFGKGLLVSNEIVPSRAKILSQNIERMGIPNAIVTNHAPDQMAELFPYFFDKIVVDAPCSGEGMFRKEASAISEWSPENIAVCADRQHMILNCADQMLAPGGTLVYSTCTFAPEEDEEMLAWFLSTHRDYEVIDWKETYPGIHTDSREDHFGLSDGNASFVHWENLTISDSERERIQKQIAGSLRLWPHRLHGEGHFAVRLKKQGNTPTRIASCLAQSQNAGSSNLKKEKREKNKKASSNRIKNTADISLYLQFLSEHLCLAQTDRNIDTDTSLPALTKEQMEYYHLLGCRLTDSAKIVPFGSELYLLPEYSPSLHGLRTLRTGLHLGSLKKNRFEPAYALAKAIHPSQCRQYKECTYEEALRYLKGETLPCDASFQGWCLVGYAANPLGWGKCQNGILKNHFPKGLRWMS